MSVCPKCKGLKHILVDGSWVRCSCVNEQRAERIMKNSLFPKPLQNLDSGVFKLSTENRKELGQAMLDEMNTFDSQPFFIYSQSNEKDKVAAIMTRYLIMKHSSIETAYYVSLGDLTDDTFNKDKPPEEKVDFKGSDILTISIGKEITNNAHRNVLYNTLYDRILSEQLTIIISSIQKAQLNSRYMEAVDSLLKENCRFFIIDEQPKKG